MILLKQSLTEEETQAVLVSLTFRWEMAFFSSTQLYIVNVQPLQGRQASFRDVKMLGIISHLCKKCSQVGEK